MLSEYIVSFKKIIDNYMSIRLVYQIAIVYQIWSITHLVGLSRPRRLPKQLGWNLYRPHLKTHNPDTANVESCTSNVPLKWSLVASSIWTCELIIWRLMTSLGMKNNVIIQSHMSKGLMGEISRLISHLQN